MKNICIITGAFNDYQILKPLMIELKKDESTYSTVISTGKHHTDDFVITHLRLEEEGFTMDEKTHITFNLQNTYGKTDSINFEQLEYDRLLKQLKPDIVVLIGSRYETFSAAIAATLNNIPIAHIQGGESEFRTWEDSYGYGITKLSHLHFTSTEKYRQQVLRFGEHSERVFNVGSLVIEKIKTLPLRGKAPFFNKIGINEEDKFIFISFHPDPAIGSKNGNLFQELLSSLTDERLAMYKLIFNKPEPIGLGKMIIQMMDDFALKTTTQTVLLPFMDLPDLSCAIKYCSVVLGNTAESQIIATSFKTPVINIGKRLQDRTRALNIIDCPSTKQEILCAIQNGLSASFKGSVKDMSSPFEQVSPARKIKDILKEYTRTDIRQKSFYSPG